MLVNGANSGSTTGAAVRIQNGGVDVGVFGNASAVLGGAYSSNFTVFATSGNNLHLHAGAGPNPAIRILTTGLVGIGTGSGNPANALSVGDGTSTRYISINGANSGTTGGAALRIQNNGSDVGTLGNRSAIAGGTYDGTFFLNANGSAISFGTGTTERMRIDSTGLLTVSSVTASGTVTVDTLMVGGASGPLLRNNAGTIEVRNNANSALANMSASQFTASFFRDSTNQANYFGAGINARNNWLIAYSNDGTDFGTKDTSISRNAAGVLQIGNGTANASGSLLLTNLTASGTVRLGTYTVGTLPSAAANTRAIAYVTDSSVSTYGSVVVAGGSTQVMVLSNGTDWVVSGGGTSGLGSFTKAQLDTAVSDGNVLYVGDAPTAHVHAGSDITTGTVDPARLGSGSSITTKFLRGDSTWQSISGGGDALVANSLDQFADVTQTAGQTLSITSSTTLSGGTHSGTNTGDNAVNSLYSSLVSNATHTGDVTGDTVLTIANSAVTLAKTTGIQKVITSGTAAPSGGSDGDIYLQYT
jgi:hypothetical protein